MVVCALHETAVRHEKEVAVVEAGLAERGFTTGRHLSRTIPG